MSSSKKESHWIPLADLMTVLMVIFLFMSISYMAIIEKKQKEKDSIFKDYKESRDTLYAELKSEFNKDTSDWSIKLENDLSIKFTDPNVLFTSGKSEIKPKFIDILKNFFPRYLSVVTKEKYKYKIAEIRIEGHTDTIPLKKTKDSYIDNMKLSQDRARNVLAFLREQDCFKKLDSNNQKRIQFWLTANGLSFGRTVDNNYQFTFESNKAISNDNSRRVEFRIVTSTEAILKDVIKKIEEK